MLLQTVIRVVYWFPLPKYIEECYRLAARRSGRFNKMHGALRALHVSINNASMRTVRKCLIDGDFSRKSQTFPTLLVYCAPAEGVPLRIGYRRRESKKLIMGLPGRQRSLTISLTIWIECTNVTDRRTDTGPQQRPRLRTASRGKQFLELELHWRRYGTIFRRSN